jgi:hypothetical protein
VSAPGAGAEAVPASAAPEGVPLTFDEALARLVDFDKVGGLVPAIVQDVADGTVLTVAYMDAEALRRTLETGRSWFYSRSRAERRRNRKPLSPLIVTVPSIFWPSSSRVSTRLSPCSV